MKIESKTVHWGDRKKVGGFTPAIDNMLIARTLGFNS